MLSAAFLLSLASPADGAPDPSFILDAFRATCQRAGDLEQMKQDARSSGWEEIADNADPRIERLTRVGREMIGEGWTLTGATFRRTVAGTSLFLIVSRAEDENGVWGSGCRLYDFDAALPLAEDALRQWMGRAPTARPEAPSGHLKLVWEPGWRDGVTVEVNHVPQDSPYRETYGLSGNVFVAQAIGGF